MSNSRVHFLFKNVLPIVVKHELLGKRHYDDQDFRHSYSNGKEAKSVVLNLRLICQAWDKAVGELAEQMESEWACGIGPQQNNAIHHLLRSSFEIPTEDRVDSFLARFGNSSRNPCFGRTILLTMTPYDMTPHPDKVYYQKIVLLLQKFGTYIRNCIFHEALCMDKHEPAYSIIINLLHLMPNLKHLELINQTIQTCVAHTVVGPPKLSKLRSIIFYSVFTPVCNAIIAENSQISRLIAVHPSYNEHVFNLTYPYPFEHLEQLELSFWSWKEMRILGSSKNAMWPLKKLKLHFHEHPNIDCEPVTWLELFDILSKCFGETLEELDVNLPLIHGAPELHQIQNDSRSNILRLPKLKKLDLTVKNPAMFGFLLGTAESLEHLRITVRTSEDKLRKFLRNRNKQVVQLWEVNNLLISNIWSIFPKLKTVRFCVWHLPTRSCNRREWLKLQKFLKQAQLEPSSSVPTRNSSWKGRVMSVLSFL